LLDPDGTHYQEERADGVDLVTIPVGWNLAEPEEGSFSNAYIQSVIAQLEAAKAVGLSVILDPGIQYAPAWAMSLSASSQFEDQYGDLFGGAAASGDEVPNAVTDPTVRTALGAYLAWLGGQFPTGLLYAVRVGGGPDGELRYPPSTFNGHTNCYWAYDPVSRASSPVPGWAPGMGTTEQAQEFIDYYNSNLANYGAWLNQQFYIDFSGLTQLLLLPGWGQRPGYVAQGVASQLESGSVELNNGTDWALQLSALPYPAATVAYTTWLDAPSQGSTPQLEDPADYLAGLVSSTSLRLGGENTGGGSLPNLTLSLARASSLGFTVVNWMPESQIYDPTAFMQANTTSTAISPAAFMAAVQQYIG
jgi:hypothetical protein